MGKTRDLFKRIRDTKGTCHAKMGTVKDRNGMDLTEAERTPVHKLCLQSYFYKQGGKKKMFEKWSKKDAHVKRLHAL